MTKNFITVDGNEAAASVAFRLSEAVAIFPITPSSPMAELCDEWASRGKTNLWGVAPEIAEMQSEGVVEFPENSESRRVRTRDIPANVSKSPRFAAGVRLAN